MIKINLLDWRAAQRERNKKEFIVWLVGAAIIGLGIIYLANHSMTSAIHHQDARNQYLKSQIQIADRQIKQIKNIKQVRHQLAKHIKVIEGLQTSRTQIVHFFESLSATMPDGIYLTDIGQKNGTTTITGRAQSNTAVSNYLKNLDQSQWFKDPSLMVISTKSKDSRFLRNNSFTLKVKNTTPKDKKDSGRHS